MASSGQPRCAETSQLKLFKLRLQESAKARGLILLVIERDYAQTPLYLRSAETCNTT
jgi:hypothetical protein